MNIKHTTAVERKNSADLFAITSVDHRLAQQIQQHIDIKAKPPGSLGRLEPLAKQLALILGHQQPQLQRPMMVVFAGDHGVADEGVSTSTSEVTTEVVKHFMDGVAAINIFCQQSGMQLQVVDAGMKYPLQHPDIVSRSLGRGTAAIHRQAAMTREQVIAGFSHARELIHEHHRAGTNVIGFGEMGVGNSTIASALMAAFTGLPANVCVGRGTGVDDAGLARKQAIVEQALALHREQLNDPIAVLTALGGFEQVQMCGAMLAAAEKQMVVLVDGFIATAAALAACAISPACKDYMVFSHRSNEQGHQLMLEYLQVEPLLGLDLRLGEGTGAALALPLLQCALGFYNEMVIYQQPKPSQLPSC